jgi:hypothetical protein
MTHEQPPVMALTVATLGCILVFLSGCSAYQLGTPDELPFASIYVEPVDNKTFAPQAASALTSQIIRQFERDGRLTPEPESSADATLTVQLVDLTREIRVMREDDTGLARKIRLTLVADCSLTRNGTGEVYFSSRRVTSETDVFLDDGQNPGEFQATPVLTRDLAFNISHAVLDTW